MQPFSPVANPWFFFQNSRCFPFPPRPRLADGGVSLPVSPASPPDRFPRVLSALVDASLISSAAGCRTGVREGVGKGEAWLEVLRKVLFFERRGDVGNAHVCPARYPKVRAFDVAGVEEGPGLLDGLQKNVICQVAGEPVKTNRRPPSDGPSIFPLGEGVSLSSTS